MDEIKDEFTKLFVLGRFDDTYISIFNKFYLKRIITDEMEEDGDLFNVRAKGIYKKRKLMNMSISKLSMWICFLLIK